MLVENALELLSAVKDDLGSQIADLRLPVKVGLFVGGQVARLREALVAVGVVAHVGLLSCVSPQMRSQVEVERESLIAEGALEGFLSSVY